MKMARVSIVNEICIRSQFSTVEVYTFPMKIRDVLAIKYVAVRGRSKEEGAVQRVLNRRRITSIKDFVLSGNRFFNTFILNWTNKESSPEITTKNGVSYVEIPILEESAQVIDGQHRLSGIEEAIKEKANIAEDSILVSLCLNLTTSEAANIFLNINSEQKPVPKSLIYDLFGEVYDTEHLSINRANDIAQELNINKESPYYQMIQFPGAARGAGFIPLSTVVTALKPHLEPHSGIFNKVKLYTLDNQKNVIFNYINSIKDAYDRSGIWNNKTKNPFIKSSGFNGAIDFLVGRLLFKCAEKKSFTKETFSNMISLQDNLILDEDIKRMDGKSARKAIKDHLERLMTHDFAGEEDYDI